MPTGQNGACTLLMATRYSQGIDFMLKSFYYLAMHKPSQRLIAEIEAAFEENDPYAVVSDVVDDPTLVEMMQEQADVWRVVCAGEVHVADPCLPSTVTDLWLKTVLVPDNAILEADEPHVPLTADDFIPAYALNVSGGMEIAPSGGRRLLLEVNEPVSGIAVQLKSPSDLDDPNYELTDTDGHLIDRFDETELVMILASLAGAEYADFNEVNPLAQCAALLNLIGIKYGVSSEEFHTAASLIPDQTERMADVSGAVIYARRHIFKNSAVTTAIERLVKYEELDTDVLYRMTTGHFVSPVAENAERAPVFMKTLASPAAYDVKNIHITDLTMHGTTHKLRADLNTLDKFADTVQQVVASVVEKTIPKQL